MFAISTKTGFVAGFSQQHQCVQTTTHTEYVKTFHTEHLAKRFIASYANAGYGFADKDAIIVELTSAGV